MRWFKKDKMNLLHLVECDFCHKQEPARLHEGMAALYGGSQAIWDYPTTWVVGILGAFCSPICYSKRVVELASMETPK